MLTDVNAAPSAPECQLSTVGSDVSYSVLLESTRELTDDALVALEKDLDYYAETGLIGVNMSKMLALLQTKSANAAA
ncbi:MAG: hypothetical protein AAF718_08920 [Pseudomonadota bacterium]